MRAIRTAIRLFAEIWVMVSIAAVTAASLMLLSVIIHKVA